MTAHKIQKKKRGQQATDVSFVGGRPALPVGRTIPTCTLCKAQQTFFFQLAFPDGHPWERQSVAVFACTQCADENHLIPELLPGELKGVKIPAGFLDSYQQNFRFVVFPTPEGRLHSRYKPRVAFHALDLRPAAEVAKANKVGGTPVWFEKDETPGNCGGKPLVFLLQLLPGWKFERLPDAPPQAVAFDFGQPPELHYDLFVGNALYLFGTTAGERKVYAVVQRD
jgi:hypothetical protein